jgi:hypothetical protein
MPERGASAITPILFLPLSFWARQALLLLRLHRFDALGTGPRAPCVPLGAGLDKGALALGDRRPVSRWTREMPEVD